MIAKSLPELFFEQSKKFKNKVLVEYRLRRNEPFRSLIWGHLATKVKELAYGLVELGLRKGDNVAILSNTRYEWAICDFAILSCGGVVVPIYPTLGEQNVNYILNNSECGLVILEDKGQLQKIRSQWGKLPKIRYAIVIEDLGDLPEHDPRILSIKRIIDKGKLNFSKDPYLIEKRLDEINTTDLATIIYTSGTTGQPKGVMLTHKNILSVLEVLPKVVPFKSRDKLLSFLPLSHVFERVGGLHYAVSTGTTISYCSSMEQVGPSLKDSGATIMLVVPRILEKIYSKIYLQLDSFSKFKKDLFNWAISVGKKALLLQGSKGLLNLDLLKYKLADLFIFSNIRKKLAPSLKYFISGGAPLSPQIGEFFQIIGIPVLEGYGLTETAAPVTVNSENDFKVGTVGKPLPNVQVKIAEDGEILIKGPNVFNGYYKNEKATKEVFKDGWFLSGDIGSLDKDGFLNITDRKKDIIVNSAGKNIAPQNIENAVKTSPFISNVIVIGDKRKYLSALITLDQTLIHKYAFENKVPHNEDLESLCKNPKIIELISEEIKLKTVDFADYEQIRKFTILPDDFTIESNEITPTLKVKRGFVEDKYKQVIDAMYPSE